VNQAGTKVPFNPQPQRFNMFNLEVKISEWRRQMLAAGIKSPMPLDELESHLREDFRTFLSAGKSENQAFELAVSRLGSPGPLRTEFNKLRNPAWWPVKIGYCLYAGAMILAAVYIAISYKLKYEASKMGLITNPILLYAHVVSITAGYCAVFFAGFFGILYVCRRLFRELSPDRQQSLDRAALLFSELSVGFVIVGTVLGMLWCRLQTGKFLMGDVKEVGALCVDIWFVVLSVLHRRRRVGERATMLMCVGGNIIVSLAWFGAAIYNDGQRMHAGWARYLPLGLVVFVGIHLLFLVMGFAPAAAKAEQE
jgi:hypothetical protein